MVHSEFQEEEEEEPFNLQACRSGSRQESQHPTHANLDNAMAIKDAVDEAQTPDPSDTHLNNMEVAQAAIDCPPDQHPLPDIESIKTSLHNSLNRITSPQRKPSSDFDGLLKQWIISWRRDRHHALLIYVLGDGSEQYKDRELDLEDLESIDRIKTDALERQCSQQGVCLYIAKMTSAVNMDPDRPLELRMAIRLHEIRDLNDELVLEKPVTVGRHDIIQANLLEERYNRTIAPRNPYPSPAEGSPTVQADTSKSFQDWVLVMLPEGYRFKFLTENADPHALDDWIKAQSKDLPLGKEQTGTDPNARWGLALACDVQLANIGTWLASGSNNGGSEAWYRQADLLGSVVYGSLRLRDPDLFGKAVIIYPRMLSLTKWREIGSTLELGRFLSYSDWLNQALAWIDSFQDRWVVLNSIREGCETQDEPQEVMQVIDDWFQEQVEQALNDIRRVEENDGAILVAAAKEIGQTIGIRRITSFAERHSGNYHFAFEFAFSLYDDLVKKTIDTEQAKHLLRAILSNAVPTFCAQGVHNRSLEAWLPSRAFKASTQQQQTFQAYGMAHLVCCCLVVGLHTMEIALLRHIYVEAGRANAHTLQNVFLPYLKQLLVVMNEYSIPLQTPSYQWQFQQVIFHFIIQYIGQEPTAVAADFTCPPLGCAGPTRPYGCATCLELDAFLVNPYRQTADIRGGIDAPDHVSAQIKGADYLQTTILSHSAEKMVSTIRITKNKAKTEEPDARHDMWRERVIKANDMIQAICGDEQWKVLLGDRYDKCMGLKAVRGG